MKSGGGVPTEMAGARDPLGNENGEQRPFARSAGGIERLADAESTTTPIATGPKQWLCMFRGDAGPMAVAVESVAEVLETDTLIRLAWSPPQVVGMCACHREVIPVVSLGPLPRDEGEEFRSGQDPPVAIDTAGEHRIADEPDRCVVLILKTEHGAWGIRVDSENTIMSRESPEWHPHRTYATGLVLIGIIRFGGTCYRIVDAAATWRGLRSAVGRWSGLFSQSTPASPPPPGEEPKLTGTSATREHRQA